MKAMILAAGMGTRLQPLTEHTPKALIEVGGHTMLDISLAFLRKHGINDIIINVFHLAEKLKKYAKLKEKEGFNIDISNETGELLDTGGGLKKASWFFEGEEDFVLLAVDVLTDLDLNAMILNHQKNRALATLAVKERNTSRNLLFDSSDMLAGWKNNQTGEIKNVQGKLPQKALGFSGIHVINTKLFELIDHNNPFSITNFYLEQAHNQKIIAFEHSDGIWLEFGRIENITDAEKNPDFQKVIRGLNLD